MQHIDDFSPNALVVARIRCLLFDAAELVGLGAFLAGVAFLAKWAGA